MTGNILFWIGIGILVIIVVLAILMQLPALKGWFGERLVRGVLKSLPKDKYIILNDLMFYGREKENAGPGRYRGKRWSCQIDHLVISPYGIFCIETKNYLGVIAGNYRDKNLQRRVLWMRYPSYSPIYQNYRHLERLVERFPRIRAKAKDLHSIVCFIPPVTLKIKGGGAAVICKFPQLRENIRKYQRDVLSWSECNEIADDIRKVSVNHKPMK